MANSIKHRAVSGVLGYGIRTVILYGIAVGATALLSIYLSPADFGIYYIVTAVISLFTFMSDIGLAATLIQMRSEPSEDELKVVFSIQQVLAFSITGLIILLTPLWKQVSKLDNDGLCLLYALAFSFVLASFKTIPSVLLERKLNFNKLVIPQVVEQIVFYGLALILASRGWGVASFTWAVLARGILGLGVIYYLQPWKVGLSFSKKILKALIPNGFKFQLNDLLARVKDDLLVVVLGRFLPANQMGYLGWAKRWSSFPYQMSVNSVIAITFPTYSRLQHDLNKLGKAIEISIFFITLILFPILAGMVILAGPIVQLTTTYHKWQPALVSLVLFAVNIAWAAVSTPLTNTLNAIGKINVTLKLMGLWTVMTWVLTPILVRWYQYEGVALASAIIGFTSIFSIKLTQRWVSFKIWESVWRQLLATILMIGCLWWLYPLWSVSYGGVMIATLGGGIAYGLVMGLLGARKIWQLIMILRE